ncbi:hypothetical protein BZA05DRAFT_129879 [Tricharina praecox]|uniref:uncharacterized protein n=1 Tax=Tricharina praecox TaxID=43433 RepID=UPI00221F497F|nr:uncharacterized protein BZA05DRAFT_129879 [Tricharina praecox]KAI5846903.1 hypothetical protein BZA05DRAFT_129879 [Tricharina praecox]
MWRCGDVFLRAYLMWRRDLEEQTLGESGMPRMCVSERSDSPDAYMHLELGRCHQQLSWSLASAKSRHGAGRGGRQLSEWRPSSSRSPVLPAARRRLPFVYKTLQSGEAASMFRTKPNPLNHQKQRDPSPFTRSPPSPPSPPSPTTIHVTSLEPRRARPPIPPIPPNPPMKFQTPGRKRADRCLRGVVPRAHSLLGSLGTEFLHIREVKLK